jgi:hypothetical protein
MFQNVVDHEEKPVSRGLPRRVRRQRATSTPGLIFVAMKSGEGCVSHKILSLSQNRDVAPKRLYLFTAEPLRAQSGMDV